MPGILGVWRGNQAARVLGSVGEKQQKAVDVPRRPSSLPSEEPRGCRGTLEVVCSYSCGEAASKVIRLDSGAAPGPESAGALSKGGGPSTLAPASSSSSMLGQTDWSSTLFSRSLRAFRASCLGPEERGQVTLRLDLAHALHPPPATRTPLPLRLLSGEPCFPSSCRAQGSPGTGSGPPLPSE